MKLVFTSDNTGHGGHAEFNWKCRGSVVDTTSDAANDVCPSKFDGDADSGCYTQSEPWRPGIDVTCSMNNAACLTTTCGASSISAFFRDDLFHTNSQDSDSFIQQLRKGTRAIYREGSTVPLVENDPNGCGYTVDGDGIRIDWEYGNPDCPVAPAMIGNMIEYSVKLTSPGNEPGIPMIEFYVDTVASASCQYEREILIDADGFWINQEDVNADVSKYGDLAKIFRPCEFFEDKDHVNQIKEHNIVNMGERIYGRVQTINNQGYGLIYKLQRVTFTDASGTTSPPSSFHVIGGGNGGMGSSIVKAAVQKSKYIPGKRYWRPISTNMKFSFLSFGFENLSEQNEVEIKCQIKIDIDPIMFPNTSSNSNDGQEYNYDDSAEWGSYDYYDENY